MNIDGSVSTGTPSGRLLASISQLTLGDHSVSIIAKQSASNSGARLSFEGATVTVGTGLMG